jgi:hypothetical protein
MERMVRAPGAGRAVAGVLRSLASELTLAQACTLLERSIRALDDEIRRLMRAELGAFRSLVAQAIRRTGLDVRGTAALLMGALDGMLLQRVIDLGGTWTPAPEPWSGSSHPR